MKSVLKTLSSPLFLVASCIFLVNRWSEFYGIYIPFVNSYLDDLMLMPIVLTMALAGMRFIISSSYRLSLWQISLSTLIFSVFFEYFIPQFDPRFTADPLDVLAYLIGALAFLLWGNASISRHTSSQEEPE
ncbi:MAG TPA: magnesium citrate secondary transporter [Flavobacteriales bacterium]|nr:hypothetical protein [Salibacteraceae bacterium]HAS36533.1 magnesium citrate secondary transporter [Flavobacteriales bacterium]